LVDSRVKPSGEKIVVKLTGKINIYLVKVNTLFKFTFLNTSHHLRNRNAYSLPISLNLKRLFHREKGRSDKTINAITKVQHPSTWREQ
jgi:hypothetical protein